MVANSMTEMKLKWKKFCDEWPLCEWIWVSDYKKVVLLNHPFSKLDPTNCVWAEAKLEFPPVPEKNRHLCKYSEDNDFFCNETDDGLEIYTYTQMGRKCFIPISFCPFCGYEAKK